TARQERPERLSETRAGGVLGGGDARVMPTVVFDEEVTVAGGGERDLGQPLLAAGDLVSELVGGVDADAAGDRDGPCHADRRGYSESALVPEPRQVVRAPQVARQDERAVLEREVEVGAPAVERVGLEAVDDLVGRVLSVDPNLVVAPRHGH